MNGHHDARAGASSWNDASNVVGWYDEADARASESGDGADGHGLGDGLGDLGDHGRADADRDDRDRNRGDRTVRRRFIDEVTNTYHCFNDPRALGWSSSKSLVLKKHLCLLLAQPGRPFSAEAFLSTEAECAERVAALGGDAWRPGDWEPPAVRELDPFSGYGLEEWEPGAETALALERVIDQTLADWIAGESKGSFADGAEDDPDAEDDAGDLVIKTAAGLVDRCVECVAGMVAERVADGEARRMLVDRMGETLTAWGLTWSGEQRDLLDDGDDADSDGRQRAAMLWRKAIDAWKEAICRKRGDGRRPSRAGVDLRLTFAQERGVSHTPRAVRQVGNWVVCVMLASRMEQYLSHRYDAVTSRIVKDAARRASSRSSDDATQGALRPGNVADDELRMRQDATQGALRPGNVADDELRMRQVAATIVRIYNHMLHTVRGDAQLPDDRPAGTALADNGRGRVKPRWASLGDSTVRSVSEAAASMAMRHAVRSFANAHCRDLRLTLDLIDNPAAGGTDDGGEPDRRSRAAGKAGKRTVADVRSADGRAAMRDALTLPLIKSGSRQRFRGILGELEPQLKAGGEPIEKGKGAEGRGHSKASTGNGHSAITRSKGEGESGESGLAWLATGECRVISLWLQRRSLYAFRDAGTKEYTKYFKIDGDMICAWLAAKVIGYIPSQANKFMSGMVSKDKSRWSAALFDELRERLGKSLGDSSRDDGRSRTRDDGRANASEKESSEAAERIWLDVLQDRDRLKDRARLKATIMWSTDKASAERVSRKLGDKFDDVCRNGFERVLYVIGALGPAEALRDPDHLDRYVRGLADTCRRRGAGVRTALRLLCAFGDAHGVLRVRGDGSRLICIDARRLADAWRSAPPTGALASALAAMEAQLRDGAGDEGLGNEGGDRSGTAADKDANADAALRGMWRRVMAATPDVGGIRRERIVALHVAEHVISEALWEIGRQMVVSDVRRAARSDDPDERERVYRDARRFALDREHRTPMCVVAANAADGRCPLWQ